MYHESSGEKALPSRSGVRLLMTSDYWCHTLHYVSCIFVYSTMKCSYSCVQGRISLHEWQCSSRLLAWQKRLSVSSECSYYRSSVRIAIWRQYYTDTYPVVSPDLANIIPYIGLNCAKTGRSITGTIGQFVYGHSSIFLPLYPATAFCNHLMSSYPVQCIPQFPIQE